MPETKIEELNRLRLDLIKAQIKLNTRPVNKRLNSISSIAMTNKIKYLNHALEINIRQIEGILIKQFLRTI